MAEILFFFRKYITYNPFIKCFLVFFELVDWNGKLVNNLAIQLKIQNRNRYLLCTYYIPGPVLVLKFQSKKTFIQFVCSKLTRNRQSYKEIKYSRMWSEGKFSRCSMHLGKEQYQWILIEVLMAELYFEW